MADEEKLSFLDKPRDDHGRFAAREARETEPKAAPQEAPPPAPEPPQAQPAPAPAEPTPAAQPSIPPGYIPLAAQLDERDKRQAIQKQLEELQRKYEEATKKTAEVPDPIVDADGFRTHFEQQIARTKWDTLTTLSRTWAVKAHGEDTVKAAEEAIKAEVERNPGFFQQIERQPDPYEFGVTWHKRQVAMSKIGDKDPEAWAEEWARQKGYVLATQPQDGVAPAALAPATQTPLPRPSLASAPAATGATPKMPTGSGSAFGAVFSK